MSNNDRYTMADSDGKIMDFTEQQKRCIDYDADSVLVIKGTAGSGKSMMVLKRALEYRKELIDTYSEDRIGIMTYTKTLAQGIRNVLEENGIHLVTSQKRTGSTDEEEYIPTDDYITVSHVDQYLVRLCKDLRTLPGMSPRGSEKYRNKCYISEEKIKTKTCTDKDRLELVQNVLSKFSHLDHPYYHRSAEFWAEEILWMYQNGIVDDDDRDKYLSMSREGRCKKYNVHMGKTGRQIAFRIFCEYNRLLVDRKLTEWDREYAILYRTKADEIPLDYKFEYLLIDEAQDLSLIKMKLLLKLAVGRIDIAMDKNQSIYGHRWSFKRDLGITPHVKKLNVVFRGTKEIDLFSSDLKKVDDSILEEDDIYENETSPRPGPKPLIIKCIDQASQMEFIRRTAHQLLKNEKKSTVAIICPDYEHLYQFQDELVKYGVKCDFFRDKEFNAFSHGIKLITTYSAKGLGFTNVIVPYFEEGVYPPSVESVINSLINNQDQESEKVDYETAIAESISEYRRLVYVGITRAKVQVIMTYAGEPSRFINEFDPDHYELKNEALKTVTDPAIHYVGRTNPQLNDVSYESITHESPSSSTPDKENSVGDEIVNVLNANKVKFIDNRSKNGCLWVPDIGYAFKTIEDLRKKGYKFKYSRNGSRNTEYKPAFYYDG